MPKLYVPLVVLACVLFLPVAVAAEKAADKKPAKQAETIIPWRSDQLAFEAEKLLRDKKYADVLDVTDKIVNYNIRNADAHAYAAQAWLALGNLDKAKLSLRNALAIDKGHKGAYVLSGLVALADQDDNQAGYYLQALRIACQGTECLEYKTLEKAVRAYQPKDD